MMRSFLVASLCIQTLGIVAAVSASKAVYNVFTSLASKFPKSNSMHQQDVGSVVTTGYLQANSFFNSDTCGSEVYAIEYVSLGVCGNYNADYSDPYAVPESCGKFVQASAFTSTNSDGAAMLNLNYTFFTDAACTVSGTGAGCTQSVAIQSSCFVSTYNGISSSAKGFLSTTVDIPAVGYHSMTHLTNTCSDQPYSGLWQRTGCIQLDDTVSAYAYCTDNSYEYDEYTSSTTCGGTVAFHDSKPLHMCDQNVFNGNDTSAVEFGIGYSMTSCSVPAPSAEPTAEPSAEPSAEPTVQPSAVPTLQPSAAPSAQFSAVPTVSPSARPSAQPSGATSAPTKQTSPIVTFTSTVTIAGLASATLDAADQSAVVATTAAAMGIDVSHVVYVSASAAVSSAVAHQSDVEEEESGALLLSAVIDLHPIDHTSSKKQHVLATVNAVTQTTISLAATAYSTTDQLYQGLTTNLQDAVADGTYTTGLRNSGATNMGTADATGVTSSPAQVSNPSSGDGKSGLSDGAIAGIVIGAVAFVALLGMLYYCTAGKSGGGSTSGSHRGGSYNTRGNDDYGYQSEMVSQQSPLRGHSAV